MDYKGSHVWIIGASSGIGLALARELARRGARLIISARRTDALIALKEELGPEHAIISFDVSDTKAFVAATQTAKNVLGRIDRVVVLSGIYEPASIAEMDIDKAKHIVEVNLGGALNALHAVLPLLRAQSGGQIALCGSVAGYRGLPYAQPYAATKAAVISLAETARLEEAKNKIDVRIINPGFVRTPMTEKNRFPMPMMITPEEAAKSIVEGLVSSSFEIHFPKRFTVLMKLLKWLPDALYFRLLRR